MAFSAGFAWAVNEMKIDGSSAVYRESLMQPGATVSYPADRDAKHWVAVGADFPIHHFNSFGAVLSWSTAMNLGALGSASADGHRFRAGFAWHNVVRPEVRLPDGRGRYFIPRRMHLSLGWSSPREVLQTHWEGFLRGGQDPEEGPGPGDKLGVDNWEIEYSPIPWLGFKLEKVWLGGLSSIGFILQPAFGNAKTRLEMNFSHDTLGAPPPEFLFGESQDEGFGLVQGFTLSVGI